MPAEKCFKPLYGFCTKTNEDLERDDCGLPVSDKVRAKLCQELGETHYTTMALHDGFCYEIVKVAQMNGHLYIERAQEGTEKHKVDCGTSLSFVLTASGLNNTKEPEDEECPGELFTGSIKNGNCTVYFKDGLAMVEKPNKNQLPDGCITNPVITMEDGCITKIAKGASITRYQNTCSKCEDKW